MTRPFKKTRKFVQDKYYLFRQKVLPRYDPEEIIITGWPASGSTFLFQVAKQLGLNVKKTHGKRTKNINFTIFTFRDPRDVICSQARRIFKKVWEDKGPETALLKATELFIDEKYGKALYDSARMPNIFLIRYEDYFRGNEHVLIDTIANNFLVLLSQEKKAQILKETSIQSNIKNSQALDGFESYDKESFIHGNHISNKGQPGAWKKHFTSVITKKVKCNMGQLLIDLGYEINYNWTSCSVD
jgi:hypothetical protein